MKITKANSNDITGTCLQGCIEVDFATLKQVFGKPMMFKDAGAKSDAEWIIRIDDDIVATIYNYKDGKNYNGSKGTSTTKIRDWHVGGKSKWAYEAVKQALREYNTNAALY